MVDRTHHRRLDTSSATPRFIVERRDWVWIIYLASVAGAFGVLEARALQNKHDSLSAFVWRVSKGWPSFGWVMGIAVGFLGAHFTWPDQGLIETDRRESR